MMDNTPKPVTLIELQRRVQRHLLAPDLRDVWVVAELSDVRVNGGHCYMELLQKDDNSGSIIAKCRAAAWANVFRSIAHNFRTVTGQEFTTGLKVMLRTSVSYHEVYGMTMVVNDVNPDFTMGDLLRRRRENIERLRREGILDHNRQLALAAPPLRVAVISASGAAGFGDFMNQLMHNPSRLAFRVKLFQAKLQGENTPASIIAALRLIWEKREDFDCVVLIRGGGASSDLIAFEDYNLAACVARFPLPVVIGIGHERDITLLDYVAFKRVKTPTAAAEWLITEGEKALDILRRFATTLSQSAGERLSGYASQLSALETQARMLPTLCVERANARLTTSVATLGSVASGRIAPLRQRLDDLAATFKRDSRQLMGRSFDHLESLVRLVDAYSPAATLRRGFTATRIGQRTLRSVNDLAAGDVIVTYFADGQITSTVNPSTTIS